MQAHYTMPYKYDKRANNFGGRFYYYFILVFCMLGAFLIKIIIPLVLVGYEMIIANSALFASLAIYHLISNASLLRRRSLVRGGGRLRDEPKERLRRRLIQRTLVE